MYMTSITMRTEKSSGDYFDEDFCKFLDDEYNGDFRKFCEESELIVDGQFDWDYFNEWLDEWDWDRPSEPDNNPY